MKEKAAIALLMAILAVSASADISLGSIADVKYLTLEKGDIGEFKASFFNMGDSALDLELSLDYPSELRAEVYPKKLTIHPGATDVSSCQDCEFFILNDGKTYVRTYPVYAYVKIPSDISRNLYDIKLTVTARSKDQSGSAGIQQSLAQVREIVFTAQVRGSVNDDLVPEEEDKKSYKTNNSDNNDWWKQADLGIRDVSGSNKTTDPGKDTPSGGVSGTTTTRTAGTTPTVPQGQGASDGSKLIETDDEGNTKINLPIGNVVLSKEESGAAIDLGIITLAVSAVSLLVRILKS